MIIRIRPINRVLTEVGLAGAGERAEAGDAEAEAVLAALNKAGLKGAKLK